MVSFYGHMMNFIFRCMPQDKPGQPHDYAAERKRNDRTPPKAPKGVTVQTINLGGQMGERIEKPGNSKGVVFYIHGGGYTTGSARERRAICLYVADRYGYDCVSVNYRLAPENHWPAPLEDVLSAYQALLASGLHAQNVVFMGESAGGHMVLSLALRLKELNLPQPRALVALSPCTTFAEVLPSHTQNIRTDYMLRDAVANGGIKIVLGDRAQDEELLRQPVVSPLYGDFTGLPPVFFSVSDTEVLRDDSLSLYEKLQKAGHPSGLDVQHGVCHAFPMFPAMPEARRAIAAVFRFLNENIE